MKNQCQVSLKGIREICDKKNIVLIFDECTSGFRETFGGIHKKFKVNPDLAMFGKDIRNWICYYRSYRNRKYNGCCQKTFISSTFWTERIGPTAALKTLEYVKNMKAGNLLLILGLLLRKIGKSLQIQIK